MSIINFKFKIFLRLYLFTVRRKVNEDNQIVF